MAGTRFSKGDTIKVYDRDGIVLAVGTALQDRDMFGAAAFQVHVYSATDWVKIPDFNLNYVKVEVVN